MKIINCEQGADEWFEARKGVFTASNFSKIITSTGKESTSQLDFIYETISDLFLKEKEASYTNENMDRGVELEPIARQEYQKQTFNIVDQVGFVLSDCGNFGCSPDGLIGDDGLIEIKCPKAKNHLKYCIDNKLPTQYVAQVQGQLYVTGRQWCDFVSFHPDINFNNGLFIVRVERDEDFISALEDQLKEVINKKKCILNKLNKDH